MMSLETIRELSNEAARKAAREHMEPYVPGDEEEVQEMPPFKFPFIGSHKPKGWRLVKSLFCDSSGFGSESEPAMTVGQLKEWIVRSMREGHDYGFAVTEAGQFQVNVGVFEKRPQRSRKPTVH